jgi:hypothetical protein
VTETTQQAQRELHLERPIGDAAKLIALLRLGSRWGVELEREMPWVAGWTRVRTEARRLLAATHETIESLIRGGNRDHLWAIVHDYSRWPKREVL